MSIITGRFEMVSSENYGEFLKAAGVGMIQRNLAEKAKPTVEISTSNGRWTIKTLTALKNSEINFALGEEFDEETADGRIARSTITMEGDWITHYQRLGDEELVTVSKCFNTEMVQTYTTKGVTATRVFKRL